ncbi:hypothetical protein KFU94_11905 [Chloroflexi bacterium TSY]|nr:hypothetical protein [Chloroflexi bacterium TSY]
MNRFFLQDVPLIPTQTVDLTPLAHQLHTVLRLRTGAQITLLDGRNQAYLCELTQIDRRSAQGRILEQKR